MERHHGTSRRRPGHLPVLLLAAIIALVLLPLSIAADDPALTPALRDPSTTAGDYTLANGYTPPFLRDPGTILSTTPNNTDVGRPSPGPGWDWQGTSTPFGHSASFSGTVNAGNEDGAVEYTMPPYRRAWAEGTYLTWVQSDIDALKSQAYCWYHPAQPGCDSPGAFSFGAAVFHAYNKNSGIPNALHQNGWAGSNLPGWQPYYPKPEEVRILITDPNSMSASTQYFAQTYYQDTAYDPNANPPVKTNGEIDYSTYLIQIVGPIQNPLNRDFNTKVCINADIATGNQGGSCP